jgi:hypothetical protein
MGRVASLSRFCLNPKATLRLKAMGLFGTDHTEQTVQVRRARCAQPTTQNDLRSKKLLADITGLQDL